MDLSKNVFPLLSQAVHSKVPLPRWGTWGICQTKGGHSFEKDLILVLSACLLHYLIFWCFTITWLSLESHRHCGSVSLCLCNTVSCVAEPLLVWSLSGCKAWIYHYTWTTCTPPDCSTTHPTSVGVFRCQFSDHNSSAPVSLTLVNPLEHKNHTDSNEMSSPADCKWLHPLLNQQLSFLTVIIITASV